MSQGSIILKLISLPISILLICLGIMTILGGHITPGGGFQGGAMIASGILLILKPFMKIYVEPTYYEAWKYTPPLILGAAVLVLSTFLSSTYTSPNLLFPSCILIYPNGLNNSKNSSVIGRCSS